LRAARDRDLAFEDPGSQSWLAVFGPHLLTLILRFWAWLTDKDRLRFTLNVRVNCPGVLALLSSKRVCSTAQPVDLNFLGTLAAPIKVVQVNGFVPIPVQKAKAVLLG
jgi:hypothetical protein